MDHIAVTLADRIADRMKIVGHFLGGKHSHVAGQLGVQGPLQHFGRQRAFAAKRGHLSQGVNAGVGPSAGQHVGSARPVIFSMATSSVPCTVAMPGWTCQPAYAVPS